MFLFFTLNLFEAFKPLEAFKDYPFGTEGGYGYHSAEEYHASALIDTWLLGLSLICGGLFYRMNQPLIGASVMLASFLFLWHIGLTYGIN